MSVVPRCRSCGAFVQEQDRFCWSCGLDLGAAEKPAAARTPLARELDPTVQLMLRRVFLAQRRGDLAEACLLYTSDAADE